MSRLVMMTVVVDDYDEAIAHYTSDWGWRLVEDTPLDGGKRWVVVSPGDEGGARVLLARAADATQRAAIGQQAGGRVFAFLHTDDLASDLARLLAAGCAVDGPRVEPYGSVAVVSDRYGNRWDMIQP
jgi:predicted enzyme related to lactoylglutathione lyase